MLTANNFRPKTRCSGREIMQLDEYTAGKRNHKYMKKVGIVACSDAQKEEYRWWCLLQIGKRYQPRHWKPQLRFLSSSMYVSLLIASSFFWLPRIRKYENQDTNWRASIMVSSIGFAHIQLRNRENRRQGHWWFLWRQMIYIVIQIEHRWKRQRMMTSGKHTPF